MVSYINLINVLYTEMRRIHHHLRTEQTNEANVTTATVSIFYKQYTHTQKKSVDTSPFIIDHSKRT